MKDSSEFHAICLDTFPPIFYLNDTSKIVIKVCHFINDWYKNKCKTNNNGNKYMVCYTFDAGPNAVLIVRNNQCLNIMMKVIKHVFNNRNDDNWIEDKLKLWNDNNCSLSNDVIQYPQLKCNGVEKVILTQIGVGAQIIHTKM